MTNRPATVADVSAVLPMVDKLAVLHEKWDGVRYDYKPGTGEAFLTNGHPCRAPLERYAV